MIDKLLLFPKEKMQPWGKPDILPPGAYDCLLLGHPGKSELYTFRFQLPAHYQIPPFKLSALCCMTVISGQLHIGEGEQLDKKNSHLMLEKSFVVIPQDIVLFFWTDEEVTLQFHGIGPIDFIYH